MIPDAVIHTLLYSYVSFIDNCLDMSNMITSTDHEGALHFIIGIIPMKLYIKMNVHTIEN